jgi:hypothetical protein
MPQKESLQSPILLPLDILQVIGVNHTHDMLELIGPASPMIIPGQVFWLFQHCNISFLVRNELGDVPSCQDTTLLCGKLHIQPKETKLRL